MVKTTGTKLPLSLKEEANNNVPTTGMKSSNQASKKANGLKKKTKN
jgi:hypothetical protein